jgi:hypothetical protein
LNWSINEIPSLFLIKNNKSTIETIYKPSLNKNLFLFKSIRIAQSLRSNYENCSLKHFKYRETTFLDYYYHKGENHTIEKSAYFLTIRNQSFDYSLKNVTNLIQTTQFLTLELLLYNKNFKMWSYLKGIKIQSKKN